MNLERHFIDNSEKLFKAMKMQAEKSIQQVSNEDLHYSPDIETNSISIIVKHISGNLFSRWTDIFTTDGEKSTRNRPTEFDITLQPTRDEMLERWENAWNVLLATLGNLKNEDVMKNIYIRKEPYSVLAAIQRQLTHYSVHIGQITFMAKLIVKQKWKTLSIPRDKVILDTKESAESNEDNC